MGEFSYNTYTWDMLQDTQGIIAVFNACLSPDKSLLLADASLATTMVDPYSAYCFICPEFKIVCELQGSNLPVGALYIREYGDRPIQLPVAYMELYPSYIDYLKTNVEGKTRRRIEARNAVKKIDYSTGSEFDLGSISL